MKKIMAILLALTIASAVQAASTVSVRDADTNDYTRTSGVAIDFDATTGLAADWAPDLTNGRMYRVDSVSLFLGEQGTTNENLYLGVYRTISADGAGPDPLSDFLGVSDNTINPSTAAVDTALTWTFATIAPTVNPRNNPGKGSEDILYFVMQTGTDAMADTGPEASDGQRPFRRIDDGEGGSFTNHLSAPIHASRPSDADVVSSRALEYEAQVTDIGEAPDEPLPPGPQDSAVSVTDAAGNTYGKTSGVAIDFDATTELTADWDPDLAAGSAYQLDSLTLFLGGQGLLNEDLYLGVYTGLVNEAGVVAATLSGFQGVSDNTFNLATAPLDTALVWTFSGAAPQVTPESNPGSGGDIFYFVLQTGTNALADTGSIQSDDRPFRRINVGGSFSDELSAVIHGSRNNTTTDSDVVTERALEYEAQLSVAGLSYGAWISQFATGGLSARTDDVEPDGMSNELEYYLGGNPTISDAATIMPMGVMVDAGVSNVFEYVYRRRTDNAALDYDVLLKMNLVTPAWTSVGTAYEVATGSTEDPAVESVTNHVPAAESMKFIKLEVTEN